MPIEFDPLAEQLLATPDVQWSAWLMHHAALLSLELIARLKQRSDALNRSDPTAAERITRAALAVAAQLPHEPLATPLAQWARGNWAIFTKPAAALHCYQAALAGYEQAADVEAIARLSSNLVFAYTTLGQLEAALTAAAHAQQLLQTLGPHGEPFLVNLGINYGWLLYECGRYHEALAVNEASLPLALRHHKYVEWAELQVNQAFTLGMVGRITASEALLRDSRERLVALEQWLTVARIDLNLAELAVALGQPASALRLFRQARAGFETLGVTMEYAALLLFEADLLVRLGAWRQARHACRQAHARFAAEGMQHYVAQALLAEAQVRRKRNPDDPQLVPLLHAAAEQFTQLHLPLECAKTQLEHAALMLDRDQLDEASRLLALPLPNDLPPGLQVWQQLLQGLLAQRMGHPELALQHLKHALTQSQQTHLIWLQRDIAAQLGTLLLTCEPEHARQQLEAAAELDELLRANLSIAELTASFQAQRSDLLPQLVQLAAQANQPLQALHYAWRANGGALLDLLALHNQPQHPQELELSRQQLATLRWQIVRAEQEEEAPAVLEALHARLREQEHAYLEQRRRVRQNQTGPAVQLPSDPRPLLRHLAATWLIEYVRCGDTLLAICADAEGHVHTTQLGSVDAINDLFNRLELKLLNYLRLTPAQRQQQQPRMLKEARSLLQRLHSQLIAPLPAMPTSGHLLIAPCAPLHLIPFAALWDGTDYLFTHYEIELIPSGALLAAPQPPRAPLGPALLIGCSAAGNLSAVATEIAAVAAALPGSQSYLDDPQALDVLRTLTQAPRILHLSAHSELDPEPSIFTSLQLTDAMLTLEQCYDLRLAGCELVVLNGCSTASGMESGGSLLAFQSALLVAGAQRVMTSLWPLADQLAATCMASFYQHLATGRTATAALRAAQRELSNHEECAHPAVWAGYVLTRR
ncbi:CHAT domain-containing tetratricopeptide repeat protein [Candidatus Viridilinea mediisalina]|uniref:CHAT domain-containing protein n=1 Tax=Candidatus Viridilinea mediisalina TaxID=2024553 RepID=A0A2A6RKW2_9CHLR|nr:CHAT domain-containing protein [Candidatus Viridilinea mediisalina]PDW03717.1 hypothetical protein CJ255_07365 [Candidatus Viridilinea mediisalina]